MTHLLRGCALTLLWAINSVVHASTFQVVHAFTGGTDGQVPFAGLTAVGSSLFGTASSSSLPDIAGGTVFTVKAGGAGFRTLHGFFEPTEGNSPYGNLAFLNNKLYGTTTGLNGVAFSIDPSGENFHAIHSFPSNGPDGGDIYAPLTSFDSKLFGVATNGGVSGGLIFSMNPDGSNVHSIHNFVDGTSEGSGVNTAALLPVGSTFYGITNTDANDDGPLGTVFAVNADGSSFHTIHSFFGPNEHNPVGGLTLVGSTLYGTTIDGGAHGLGVIFSLGLDGSNYQVLHSFAGGGDGASPLAALTLVNSTLYGTTFASAPLQRGNGTVFSINVDGSNFQTLHSFAGGADGAKPLGNLTLLENALYGTASDGNGHSGVVFSLSVPEPGTYCMAALGLIALVAVGGRSRSSRRLRTSQS